MIDKIFVEAFQMASAGETFAIATVVRAERPTSAKTGAKALITADGKLTGWIGGSCAEPTVRREAKKALRDGQPRLIRLCPPEDLGRAPQEGVIEVALTCISGGTLEIYIEPQLSQPQLIAIGHLATTEALSRLGNALGYPVTVMGLDVDPERFPDAAHTMDHIDFSHVKVTPHTYIVVATHGNYDEPALEAALRTEASYVALIASKSRAEATLQYLHDSDLTAEQVRRLKFPAGLDFGAVTPEEIALSILAEIIQLRRRAPNPIEPTNSHEHAAHSPAMHTAAQLEPGEARDPVCGMIVEIATAHFTSEHEDVMYYFCAAGCKRSFEAEPEKYLIKE